MFRTGLLLVVNALLVLLVVGCVFLGLNLRDAVQKMYRGITANLHRWQHTLGAGPAEHVQKGEFRYGPEGRILQARKRPKANAATVPATAADARPRLAAQAVGNGFVCN